MLDPFTSKQLLRSISPIGTLIYDVLKNSNTATHGASEKGLSALQLEASKQKYAIQLAEAQARVAQEMAIASRIENSLNVQIEEFYDMSGEGTLGLTGSMETKSATLGATGSGRRVTKRVYHFKGFMDNDDSMFTQDFEKKPDLVVVTEKAPVKPSPSSKAAKGR